MRASSRVFAQSCDPVANFAFASSSAVLARVRSESPQQLGERELCGGDVTGLDLELREDLDRVLEIGGGFVDLVQRRVERPACDQGVRNLRMDLAVRRDERGDDLLHQHERVGVALETRQRHRMVEPALGLDLRRSRRRSGIAITSHARSRAAARTR